jgi:hypothetical protein
LREIVDFKSIEKIIILSIDALFSFWLKQKKKITDMGEMKESLINLN